MANESAPSTPSQPVSNTTTTAPQSQTPPSTQAAEAKKALKLLKADGQEFQLDEDSYNRFAQRGVSAEKRYQEAAAERKQVALERQQIEKEKAEISSLKQQFSGDESQFDYLIKQAQGNPDKLSKVRQKMEAFLIEQIKAEQQSPEQQAYLREKAERERIQSENEEMKKSQQQKEMEALTATHRTNIEGTIMEALDISGLPANEWNVKHMADLMHKAFVQKQNITPQQLAHFVRQDRTENIQSIFGDYATGISNAHEAKNTSQVLALGEALTTLAGDKLLNALRLYDLAKIRSKQPEMPKKIYETKQTSADPNEKKKGAYGMTWEEAEADRKRRVAEMDAEWKRR